MTALQDVLMQMNEVVHMWWDAQEMMAAQIKEQRKAMDAILGVLMCSVHMCCVQSHLFYH